ncbi:MAG: hypothetical protein ACLT1B_00395 [Anaerobutyricum hallii]
MYYDFEVPLPDASGKLAYEKHGDTTYVKHEYERIYDLEKRYRDRRPRLIQDFLYLTTP